MEEWKDVKGYEGLYQVSGMGRVKSIDRIDCANRKLKGIILKQCETRGHYLMVGLSKDGIIKCYRVNRLVALAHIANEDDSMLQVGHIDDDKQNNNVNNLYWTDSKENNTHNNKHLMLIDKISKSIIGICDGDTVIFKSSIDAGKNGFNASAIRNCLIGLAKTHRGYIWKHII